MQEQTVLNIFLIFMVLVLFMFALFLTRVLRRMESPYEYKSRTFKSSLNKIRASMREGFYEKLTKIYAPFFLCLSYHYKSMKNQGFYIFFQV